jgi:hypothetical protein
VCEIILLSYQRFGKSSISFHVKDEEATRGLSFGKAIAKRERTCYNASP